MLAVLDIMIVIYVVGAIACAALLMFEEDDHTFRFSWTACVWGVCWILLVFVYGPYIVLRDIFRGEIR